MFPGACTVPTTHPRNNLFRESGSAHGILRDSGWSLSKDGVATERHRQSQGLVNLHEATSLP